jgi:hypothetical protein
VATFIKCTTGKTSYQRYWREDEFNSGILGSIVVADLLKKV